MPHTALNETQKITEQDVENVIASEHFYIVGDALDALGQPTNKTRHLLTHCVLILKNGFKVTGESACADPREFNKEAGRKWARLDATRKIWPFLGYELRTKIAAQGATFLDRLNIEVAEVGERRMKLHNFIRDEEGAFGRLDPQEQQALRDQERVMREYENILVGRIARLKLAATPVSRSLVPAPELIEE